MKQIIYINANSNLPIGSRASCIESTSSFNTLINQSNNKSTKTIFHTYGSRKIIFSSYHLMTIKPLGPSAYPITSPL